VYEPIDAIIHSPLSTVKIVRNISSLYEQVEKILITNHRKHIVFQLKRLNIYICQNVFEVYPEKLGKNMKNMTVRERVNINALHSVYSVLVCVLYSYRNE
jgi:hypothetical protein